MSKIGIAAWIITGIFVVWCFWVVGCSSDSGDACAAFGLSPQGPDNESLVCKDGVWQETTQEEVNE